MTPLIPLLSVLLFAPQLGGEYRHPTLVLQEGQVPGGGGGRPITYLSGPAQDGAGRVGMVGHLDDGLGDFESFLWVGDSIFLLSSQLDATGIHGRILGIGLPQDTTKAAWALAVNDAATGKRFLRSHQGVVMKAGQHATGLPAGWTVTDIRTVEMLPDGALAWNVLCRKTNGGQATAQYYSKDATQQNTVRIFRDGMTVGGGSIRKFGAGYDYDFSDDSSHHAQVMNVNLPGAANTWGLYLDGKFALLAGDSAGGSDTWRLFRGVAVNDTAQLVVTGEIVAPDATDAVLAHKGQVVQREGGFVDGVFLQTPAEPSYLSLNNDGAAIYVWAIRGGIGPYAIFHTPDVDDFSTTRRLVSEGDPLDLDGDGNAEATLNLFRFDGGPALTWGPDGKSVYIAVKIGYGAATIDGVIEYPIP